jgi:hypothetical protein
MNKSNITFMKTNNNYPVILDYNPICLYDDNDFHISKLDNENVIYIAYIGRINDKHTFKFGISSRVFERDLLEHRKSFDQFKLIYVKECNNNKKVELLLKKCLKLRNIYINIKINNKHQTELFVINSNHGIIEIKNILDKIIVDNPSKIEIEQNNKIQELTIKNLEYKIELLKSQILLPSKQEISVEKDMECDMKNRCLICLKYYSTKGTNPTVDVRKEYLDMAKKFKYKMRCHYFNTEKDLSIHNNSFRHCVSDGSSSMVPQIAYNIYKSKFEKPSTKEGFNEVDEIDFVLDKKGNIVDEYYQYYN